MLSKLKELLSGGEAKKPTAPPAKTKKTAAKSKAQKAKTQPTKEKKPGRKKESTMEDQLRDVISTQGDLPGFEKIISSVDTSRPIQLSNPSMRDNFLIAVTSERDKRAVLIEAVESLTHNPDHTVQRINLRQRAQMLGYRCDVRRATSEVIRIAYENDAVSATNRHEDQLSGQFQEDFDELLLLATKMNASDIHIEVRRTQAKIRFRKDGDLIDHKEIPVVYAREFAGVIYRVIAEEKDVTFKPSETQDAVIDRQLTEDLRMRVRLATMPAYPQGFDCVMRLLPMGVSREVKELSTLGYNSQQIADIKRAMSQPVGVTIVSGTTGSGKSTTLVTVLSKVIKDKQGKLKVISVEDPPESLIHGATQVPVVRSKKVTGNDTNPFAASIRAAMRSDPDVLFVGETRDKDSAQLLTHAVQSGHQVYTTIHAPSAIGIVSRLRSIGTASDVLGSQDFIAGLVYQTLVQTVCPKCCVPITQSKEMAESKGEAYVTEYLQLMDRIAMLSDEHDISQVNFRGKGCKSCTNGITGRTVVAEVCTPTLEMYRMFSEGRELEAYQIWRAHGGKNVLDTAIEKLTHGMCDPFDLEHKVGPLNANILEKLDAEDSE